MSNPKLQLDSPNAIIYVALLFSNTKNVSILHGFICYSHLKIFTYP